MTGRKGLGKEGMKEERDERVRIIGREGGKDRLKEITTKGEIRQSLGRVEGREEKIRLGRKGKTGKER